MQHAMVHFSAMHSLTGRSMITLSSDLPDTARSRLRATRFDDVTGNTSNSTTPQCSSALHHLDTCPLLLALPWRVLSCACIVHASVVRTASCVRAQAGHMWTDACNRVLRSCACASLAVCVVFRCACGVAVFKLETLPVTVRSVAGNHEP